MTSATDQRIIRVTLDLEDGPHTYEGPLAIRARGRMFGSPLMNQCQIDIFNLTREHRNYILTQASPLKRQRTPINVSLDVGRESYGTFRMYQGYCVSGNASQPPDLGITLTSLTSNYLTGLIIQSSQPGIASLRTIAQGVAKRNGLILDFQATDKQIENYSYSGSAAQEINNLQAMGDVNAYVSPDNKTLFIIDSQKALNGDPRKISATTGMVGVPQVTDSGVIVQLMVDNTIRVGGAVEVESEIDPAANGTFAVKQIDFDIATRDEPFFYTLQLSNLEYYQGTV